MKEKVLEGELSLQDEVKGGLGLQAEESEGETQFAEIRASGRKSRERLAAGQV